MQNKERGYVPKGARRFLFPVSKISCSEYSGEHYKDVGITMKEMLLQIGKASPSSVPLKERAITKGKSLSKRLGKI